jgi:hypothetical protein
MNVGNDPVHVKVLDTEIFFFINLQDRVKCLKSVSVSQGNGKRYRKMNIFIGHCVLRGYDPV